MIKVNLLPQRKTKRAAADPSSIPMDPVPATSDRWRGLAQFLRKSVRSAVVDVLDTYSGHTDPGGAAARRDLGALTITKVSVGPMDNNAYLLVCTATGEALLIDAANEPDRLAEVVASAGGAQLRTTVTTHRHYDHWQALGAVADKFGTRQIAHPLDAPELPTVTLRLAPAGRWVVERFPIRSQHEDGDVLVVEMVVASERWLRQLLVQLGPNVVVAAPEQWVGLAADAARELLDARYAAAG